MRKLLLSLLVVILIATAIPVSASTTSQTIGNAYYDLIPNGQQAAGLRVDNFQGTISAASFYLRVIGEPHGSVWAMVRSVDGDVDLGTLGIIDQTSISTGWIVFDETVVVIDSPTSIKIFVESDSGDSDNHVQIKYQKNNLTTWSRWCYYSEGWKYSSTYDATYEVIYDSPTTTTTTTTTSTTSTDNSIVEALAQNTVVLASVQAQLQSIQTSLESSSSGSNADVLGKLNEIVDMLNTMQAKNTNAINGSLVEVDRSLQSLKSSTDQILAYYVEANPPETPKEGNTVVWWVLAIVMVATTGIMVYMQRRRNKGVNYR